MKKSELEAAIRAALADVPYPGDDNIGASWGRDDGESVTEWLIGMDWRLLKSAELWPPAMYWMTPEARQYYLPAYLLASLEDDSGDVDESTISFLLIGIRLYYAPVVIEEYQKFILRLTLAQKHVIKCFLTYMLEIYLEIQRTNEYPDLYEETIKEQHLSIHFWSRV